MTDPPLLPASDAPARWRALWTLGVAVVLTMSPWFSAAAVLPQLRDVWHLTPAQAALLTLAVQGGFVLGALVTAALNVSDLVRPARLMLWGGLVAGAANAAIALDVGFAGTVVLRAVTGAALAWVYPPALKSMATWFRRERGLALGVMVGALTLGSALPHLVNGLGGLAWPSVLLTTGALAVLGGVIAARVPGGPYPFPQAVFDPRGGLRALSAPAVRLTTLGYLGHMWELYAMWAWFAPYYASVLREGGGADVTRAASLATFAVIGVGALGCWAGGMLGDRWGRTRLTALAMLLSGLSAVTLAAWPAPPAWGVLAVGLFWGFWVIADSAQFSTITSEISDARYVGTALTLQLALGFTLTAVTITLVPIVQAAASWQLALGVLAVGPFLGAVAMLRLRALPDAARIAGGRG